MSWLISTRTLPIDIAGVAPTLDYRFALDRRRIESVSLTDKLTFSGGNQGTFVGSDGFIQRAQTNVPRFDHDPLTRRSLGMRLEASGENMLLWSENFEESTWSRTTITNWEAAAINSGDSPDGRRNAELVIPFNGGSLSIAFLSQNTTKPAASGTYTLSCFGKKQNYNLMQIFVRDTASNNNRALFGINLDDGSVEISAATAGSFGSAFGQVQQYENGYYRAGLTFTSGTETSLTTRIYAQDTIETTGDGTSGIYLWGAQLNPGPLTSYIATTTAAVTRTADSAVLDGTGIITGTYTMVEKPSGCAVVSGTNINLQTGFTAERIMVFPAALSPQQITAIRNVM